MLAGTQNPGINQWHLKPFRKYIFVICKYTYTDICTSSTKIIIRTSCYYYVIVSKNIPLLKLSVKTVTLWKTSYVGTGSKILPYILTLHIWFTIFSRFFFSLVSLPCPKNTIRKVYHRTLNIIFHYTHATILENWSLQDLSIYIIYRICSYCLSYCMSVVKSLCFENIRGLHLLNICSPVYVDPSTHI